MPANVPARSILTQLWCLCPFGCGIRTMRVSESLIRIDGLGNPHAQFLRMTHPKEQGGTTVCYGTAAYFRIWFSRSMKDLSSVALRMLYLNCIRISESAGTSNAASNIMAVAVVSGRRAFSMSFKAL